MAARHGAGSYKLLAQGMAADSADEYHGTPLMTATGYNSLNAAKILLEAGANVHARDGVIHAASKGDMIHFLVEAGADVNSRSRRSSKAE